MGILAYIYIYNLLNCWIYALGSQGLDVFRDCWGLGFGMVRFQGLLAYGLARLRQGIPELSA